LPANIRGRSSKKKCPKCNADAGITALEDACHYKDKKMKKNWFIMCFVFVILLGFQFQAAAQLTPEEVSSRPKWEEFLKTAEIVRSEDIPEGVTKPIRLFLKKDEIEASGAWKMIKGRRQGVLEGWRFEIAAYEMDKLLGLNMVPTTVERIFRGKKGSLQFWMTFEMSELDRMEQSLAIPSTKANNFTKRKYLMLAFDSLIANEDRTQENICYTKDWRLILIDHSQSFRSSGKHRKNLVYGEKGIKQKSPFSRLPRVFVEKIKALSFDSIENVVGSYLNDKEIEAILARKELLLTEIDEMIKEKGEEQVLY
jgi:hypothetical protein